MSCRSDIPEYSADSAPPVFFYKNPCIDTNNPELSVSPGSTAYLTHPSLQNSGFNDNITVAVVPPNTRATVWKNRCHSNNECTQKRILEHGTHDLRDLRFPDNSQINDQITELRVDSITPHRDWVFNCCQGRVNPSSICNNYANRQGTDCRALMNEYCQRNATNFFSIECREYLSNLDEERKNTIASNMCRQASTESQRDWCSCYSAKIPPEWVGDPILAPLFRCLDPKCEGGNNPNALRPFGLVCPTSYVSCEQDDIKLQLIESGIDEATVVNNCGNIGASPGPSPAPSPGPGPSPSPSPSGSNRGIIIGVIIAAAIVAIIIVVLLIIPKKTSRSK